MLKQIQTVMVYIHVCISIQIQRDVYRGRGVILCLCIARVIIQPHQSLN